MRIRFSKKIQTILYIALGLFCAGSSFAQGYYWVGFTDKNNSAFSIDQPEQFLSERAIERRLKQNILIDSLDLPVNAEYIKKVGELGADLVHASKWLNGATFKTETDDFSQKAIQLQFVNNVQFTKPAEEPKSGRDKFYVTNNYNTSHPAIDSSYYGPSVFQVGQIKAHELHNNGYQGHTMQIAVLDAGFYKVNEYPAFDSLWAGNQILGTMDFVDYDSDVFASHYHGMSVLSCMGGLVPGELIGTAPKASYWLLRSEDAESEYLIEEDNWVVAAEFADSVGADVINSSLGYYVFDDSTMNHTYQDLDGKTTRAAIAAGIAGSRGMLVFSSVGNEGNNNWKYLITPSDGDNVIAVGAVNAEGEPTYFTSYGPAADGDVKPNAVALGRNTYLQKIDGTLGFSNGTSYSSPVLAGAGACLWQANPDATAAQVKFTIEQSAHLYPKADSLLGYGIPDMVHADNLLKSLLIPDFEIQNEWTVFPNPVKDYIIIQNYSDKTGQTLTFSFYSLSGQLLQQFQKPAANKIVLNNLHTLPAGLLILKVQDNDSEETLKLSKIR